MSVVKPAAPQPLHAVREARRVDEQNAQQDPRDPALDAPTEQSPSKNDQTDEDDGAAGVIPVANDTDGWDTTSYGRLRVTLP